MIINKKILLVSWSGLALIFDSCESKINGIPRVSLHINNDTPFEHPHEGASTYRTSCIVDYRSSESKTSTFRLRIDQDSVQAWRVNPTSGLTEGCFGPYRGFHLPKQAYFGISASTFELTGNLHLDHKTSVFKSSKTISQISMRFYRFKWIPRVI